MMNTEYFPADTELHTGISRVKPVVSHQVAPTQCIHLHDVSHMWQSTIE